MSTTIKRFNQIGKTQIEIRLLERIVELEAERDQLREENEAHLLKIGELASSLESYYKEAAELRYRTYKDTR